MLSCTHFPSKKRARDRHGQKRSASCVYRPSSANALNLKRHRLAFWPETELSKIERSFKLISVVLSERGSKETLGARVLAKSVGIRKNFIVRTAVGQSFAISAFAASSRRNLFRNC